MRLRWGNVDLQAQALSFTPSKTSRLGKKLVLPLHAEIETFLLKHPPGASDDAPLFPSLAHRKGADASKAFRNIMARAGVAAGIARQAAQGSAGRNVSARTFHSLRHGFVSALSQANVAVELRKQLAGHSSETQSLHYTHVEFIALGEMLDTVEGESLSSGENGCVVRIYLIGSNSTLSISLGGRPSCLITSRRHCICSFFASNQVYSSSPDSYFFTFPPFLMVFWILIRSICSSTSELPKS